MSTGSRLVRTSRRLAAAAVAAAFLVAIAAGCHFAVVSDPNDPLRGARAFAVEPVGFNGLMVGRKPEPVYLSEKDAGQQQSWQTDKAELSRLFSERFNQQVAPAGIMLTVPAPGNPAPFIVRMNVNYIEPGTYTFFVNIATEVRMSIDIFSLQGQPLGGTVLSAIIPATMGNPSSGQRLRQAGEHLGNQLGHYLLARTGFGY